MELTVFWRWWIAGTTSHLGSAVGAVALPLTALTVLDASVFEMGLITAAGYLAYLLISLPAGVIVQRMPLRGMQVALDLIRALAIASVPLAWWFDTLTVAQLVAVALVVSFANVLFDVANQTFLPEIVPAAQLQARNSLNSGTHAATQLGGPSLGGLAVQLLGAVPTLFVDAVSYLISAVLLRTLPRRRVQRPAERPPMVTMIREGWHFVVRHPIIGPAMWDATVTNFVSRRDACPLPVLPGTRAARGAVPRRAADRHRRPRRAHRRRADHPVHRRFGTARGLIIAAFVGVAGALVIPLGTGTAAYLAFAVGNIVFAGSSVVLSVTTRTYRMLASPPHLLSRVIATVKFVSWGAIPLGGLLAGALAGPLGARTTLLIFGALTILSPIIYLSTPIRRLRDLPLDTPPKPAEAPASAEPSMR